MMPKCSLIISVYKDTKSLELILQTLTRQTIIPNEIIISEDGDSIAMKDFVKTAKAKYPQLNLTHLFQEDLGWRKNVALNKAVVNAENEYLIFIDGDCILFEDFIEAHLLQAQKGVVLSGKRVELGKKVTEKIYNKEIDISKLTNYYFLYLPQLLIDNTKHLEDIIHISAKSWLAPKIKRHVRYIIGCNWSAFKEDIYKINGFDETYIYPSVGEDIDLGWRFRGMGIELKSVKHNANMLHLYHKKRFDAKIREMNDTILQKNFKQNKFFCDNGIKKVKNADSN